MKKQHHIRRPDTRDTTYPKVSLDQARQRLEAHGAGYYHAAPLADVIWPGRIFRSQQGAGAAAVRILKRLGYSWEINPKYGSRESGWKI